MGFALTTLSLFSTRPVTAQVQTEVVVDSIAIEGNLRVSRGEIIARMQIAVGDTVTYREIRDAEIRLWQSGQFRDIRVFAPTTPGSLAALLTVRVEEEAVVRQVRIEGLERVSTRMVRDSAGLAEGVPYNPQAVISARDIIRGELADEGIPFATIQDRIEPVEGMENVFDLIIEVDEGNRVAIAQVAIEGNEMVPDDAIIGAMQSKPEGFWWFRSGTYEEAIYEQDILASIPDLYRSRGFLDFELLSDTLIVDPVSGKARIEIEVNEGPRYRVASLTVEGSREFDNDLLETIFLPRSGGLLASLGIGGSDENERTLEGRVFDAVAFDDARQEIQQLYANEGYIYAQVVPFVTMLPPEEEGGDPRVAVGVDIQEGLPAFINRVIIEGNDYTWERVIRDRITILPGDTYSQDRVLQSYQNINGLGFFETPLPIPDIRDNPETGEVDVTFRVVEKSTGAINFGTSVGGGVGLAGFIGYDQPNLFGQAKSGSLRWDFGRYLNNFTLSYTDPALFQTRTSGTIQLFNSRDRFFQFSSGRRQRVGGSLRFGFPIPGARFTSFFAGYSIARTKYTLFEGTGDNSLFGLPPGTQSTFTLGVARNRLNHPIFPTQGTRLSWNTEFNGGLLGGDGDFIKHGAEAAWWLPIGQVGDVTQGRPIIFALGSSVKFGSIFGDASNFPFDRFWMGGVQFGEQLRGYDETSITPFGWFPERSRSIADVDRLGNAFLSISTELAMRLNDNISLSAFFDAGNVWEDASAVNPYKLYRGAGIGAMLVTPFGPIGLDYAYGFDKPQPGWQLHFRMGPNF